MTMFPCYEIDPLENVMGEKFRKINKRDARYLAQNGVPVGVCGCDERPFSRRVCHETAYFSLCAWYYPDETDMSFDEFVNSCEYSGRYASYYIES